jgi:uncharacterized protein YgbK (DUF1537 family)
MAIIADDLTGAADTGAAFAEEGRPVLLALTPGSLPPAGVVALSTESRHLPQAEAESCVRQAAGRLQAARFYKKIDSTLRGHPGAELAVLMESLGLERALVAPAFPAQGRITLAGRQYVDGQPLDPALLTLFGRDPRRPAKLLDLETVRRGPGAISARLGGPEPAIWVADAETEADLTLLAQAALESEMRLLCGSAGLARALAAGGNPHPRPLSLWERGEEGPGARGPALVVAGSRHPRTLRQVEFAGRQGVAIVRPQPGVTEVQKYLRRGRPVIVTTAGLEEWPAGSAAVAARLAQIVLETGSAAGGLALTGGDIAAAVCATLKANGVWLYGEVAPGIPWGILAGRRVVTKAGGFGADNALVEIIQFLSGTSNRHRITPQA